MRYKSFGKTGIKVSELSFGTMTFGGEADEKISEAIYKRCREAGINLFDCANIYHQGRSEEILGRLIQNERSDIILTSKAYFATGKDVNARGLSRRHILQAVEESLKRLKTDYIDVYFLHHFDEQTPLEESLEALHTLISQGKILYTGVSNFAAWQIMKSQGLSALHGWPAFKVIQPMYNLLKRQAEVEILPMALSENLAVVPYNPLAGGFLTGKYGSQVEVAGTRFYERGKMYQLRYTQGAYGEITQNFVEFARSRGYSPVSLAIAWVASHPAVTSPLLGARSVQQLEECLQSLAIEMTGELRQEITSLTPEPPLATDRSEELVADPNILLQQAALAAPVVK